MSLSTLSRELLKVTDMNDNTRHHYIYFHFILPGTIQDRPEICRISLCILKAQLYYIATFFNI